MLFNEVVQQSCPLDSAPLPTCHTLPPTTLPPISAATKQVVLPMLFNEVVQQTCDAAGSCTDKPGTWVTSAQFYAGLGIVQALPGPLFNFSAYLGAIMAVNAGYTFIVGTLLAWFGLFSPGIMVRER